MLWNAVSVLLAAGGRRARSGAVRGLAAVAVSSAVSNGLLKPAFRRQRPGRPEPLVPRPGSFAFPSGHSASASAFAAHAEAELGIDPEQLARPWHAAFASLLSFTVGAVLPLLAITLVPAPARVIVTVIAVLAALSVTGAASAALGRAPRLPAVLRNVLGGAIAMGVTYGIGSLIGASGR